MVLYIFSNAVWDECMSLSLSFGSPYKAPCSDSTVMEIHINTPFQLFFFHIIWMDRNPSRSVECKTLIRSKTQFYDDSSGNNNVMLDWNDWCENCCMALRILATERRILWHFCREIILVQGFLFIQNKILFEGLLCPSVIVSLEYKLQIQRSPPLDGEWVLWHLYDKIICGPT